ncbi:LysR family transcriptional regulator [Burkholderia thailandensis]|uniref:LysR substrate binding domain protein n=2 Tax=Burkholderia thailandensis TaxID=57975 RepID=A0AAW9CPQ3_BURTH|nr:LysR family transcriptional regulator [Burkholderia thailandensis]ABC35890.1 transcriptional regulator, LysR family [Burkholderia thailandensis E264]AHI66516.1 bacterial regulatory helix-turn-helix, lysR family protein [Burkholderia thailandensis H0587]AHI77192.1 bacterial regulatory helix-turn-helix, lysR family protein [Burkholderia thailandensis 2002721723]AHI81712.1 bacterial regulatory helix-turn-helix, lysR family protein [Burkholderia thailandensis E444]AIC89042.1 bacterial regulator
MNFTHLSAFLAVVEAGSVTGASARLHVSQPALTREIRDLEERLGVVLFDRRPRGMSPTEAGRLLAGYAKRIFALTDEAEAALDEFSGLVRGNLKLAASRTIGSYLLPPVLDVFCDRYPGVTIDVAEMNTELVEAALLTYERQLGFVEGAYDTTAFDSMVFGRDTLLAVAASSHPLARKHRVGVQDIADCDVLSREPGSGTRNAVETAFAEHGLEFAPRLSVGSAEAMNRLLLRGNAIAWVSRFTIEAELEAGALVPLRVTDMTVERDLTIIWHKGATLSPSARIFRDLLVEQARARAAP